MPTPYLLIVCLTKFALASSEELGQITTNHLLKIINAIKLPILPEGARFLHRSNCFEERSVHLTTSINVKLWYNHSHTFLRTGFTTSTEDFPAHILFMLITVQQGGMVITPRGSGSPLAEVNDAVQQEFGDYSIPDKILLSESFELLFQECKSAVRRLAEVSEEYFGIFAALESNYSHVHLFTEQLSLFARPVSLSVTLPFLGENSSKSAPHNTPFSPRTVLAKDYAQILRQVDSFWFKVGSQLQSFSESINEPVVLSTLQKEVSLLSALVAEVTEKTDDIYRLSRQTLTGAIDKEAHKVLKIEHLKLKKISRRLDNVRELMSHLEGEKTEKPWFDLSPCRAGIVTSTAAKVFDLIGGVHEVWLKQIELREIFKLAFIGNGSNQPFSVGFSSPKPNLNSISLSTSNPAPQPDGNVSGLCCWRQRLRTSRSDSCLPCMQCLRQPERSHYPNHCTYFTASGESGFVSDSDNARLRRHRCHRHGPASPLAERCIRCQCRSFSFPLPINLVQCLLIPQPPESSKDESSTSNQVSFFEECASVRDKRFYRGSKNTALLFSPHFSLNPGVASSPIVVSPICSSTRKYPRGCDLSASERPGSLLQPYNSTFSVLSSTNANKDDNDDEVKNVAIGGALAAGEEEDSALVTSPTSYSFPHDTDNEVDENEDEGLFAHLYLGNEYKERRCLSRSLPSLLDKRPVGWSVLQPFEESFEQQSQQQQSQYTMEEAYVPIIMLSEGTEDEAEGRDTTLGVESRNGVGAGDTSSRLALSPLSCRSEDLASLAAALRLSPADSEKLFEVLRDASDVINWLSSLETLLYVPTEPSDSFSSDLLCRLRPELSRVELDKRLSELQYYAGRLERWRQEVNMLIERHKARLVDLESQANKLLVSDHGFLSFFPSWLDMIASRRSEVERELHSQVCLLDYINYVNSDSKKKLQEIENQAGPAISEAQFVAEQLRSPNVPLTDVADCYQSNGSFLRSVSNIPALTERLQDLLERASELDPRSNLLRQPSVETLSDNQILRARLRSSLAKLHNLSSPLVPNCIAPQHQQITRCHADVSPSSRPCLKPRWNSRRILCVALLCIVIPLLCYILFRPGWYSVEARHRCDRDYFLCFASAWSRSLCIVIPSFSSSVPYSPTPPPT
ncbi:unnamed protein product [Hydatigera taeniaeformis]|uniref:KASH domain-containing protein n=1 Tax=Hydatigena taeniaeformis TaxID=6205 RepID=A0A158RDZ5_HYDTA|nr:unnamed protein product [Hydatigera taeniaeformis]